VARSTERPIASPGIRLDRPVSPEHLAATVYQAMGIAENLVIQDRQGRMLSLLEDGQALPLFG
jgi:hypothetical protein